MSIKGRVVAGDSGRPLRRAVITVTSPALGTENRTASTGLDGRYEIKDLPAGRYTIRVQRSGYLGLQYGQRRPLEHRRREVEADDLAGAGLPRRHGEVARAAAAVEHPVARRDHLADGQPPPALVEADGHDPVHRVVDGRDAVEHRAHALGRQGARLVAHWPHLATSELSSPS